MNQDKKGNNSTESNHGKIDDIEKLVDQIILKNKAKLEKTYENEINANRFLFQNNRKSVFYIKNARDDEKKKKSEAISNEIISKARKNLGEKPIKKDSFTPPFEKKIEKPDWKDYNTNKKSFLGKNAKEDSKDGKTHDSKEIFESDEFDRVVSDIENK